MPTRTQAQQQNFSTSMQSPHPCVKVLRVKKLGTVAPLPIAAPVTGGWAIHTGPAHPRAAKGRTPMPNFFSPGRKLLKVPKG